ncbi:hypothetical protein [Brevundimonas lenta]|uniref:Uncharacterized protein n=1 Tax=Brevundimonas lenta TaxID=424796 RepID=A0A7W6JFV7_9CAUL|nr:hypothetical protein [Brevundimonas lenta]MBB4084415.1 hypothetical protein [Brevundimonas lenta]
MLIAALALLLAQDAGPLEPGRSGQVQCYGPDVAARTCTAIGAYRFAEDGTIWNDAQNLINAAPRIVLHATAKVYVRNDAECARQENRGDDITAIEVDGVPLEGQALETARKQIADNMQTVLGDGEFCTTYHPNPDGSLRAAVTIDGVDRPEFESTVLWIDPAQGWTLALPQ